MVHGLIYTVGKAYSLSGGIDGKELIFNIDVSVADELGDNEQGVQVRVSP